MRYFTRYSKLETDRLTLRFITKDDREVAFQLRSDKDMLKYVQRTPMIDLDQADAFIKRMVEGVGNNVSLYWLMEIKSTKQVIGSICLWNFSEDYKTTEIGYAMLQKFHGKGFMSEAVQAVIELGKTALDLENIEAFTHHANSHSTQLLIRHGFRLDLHRRDEEFPNNRIFTRYIEA